MARTIVTGDLQRGIIRKLAELLRQASQEKGYPHDPAALDEVLQHLNQFGPESLLRGVAGKNCLASATPGAETVTVTADTASALVHAVNEAVDLTHLNPDYAKYAFLQGECGKTYEVLTWKPGKSVSSDAEREHFSTLGFRGNTAAFLEWNRKDHGDGWFVSIPEDDRCFRATYLYAPYFRRHGAIRGLHLRVLAGDWGSVYVFVAFREVLAK
jgi:hypothetical protein